MQSVRANVSLSSKSALVQKNVAKRAPAPKAVRSSAKVMAAYNGEYAEELVATANKIASAGHGILAMDESNGTCGLRLADIGVENIEENRRLYRELLCTTDGLGEYISGAILFEETLYQSDSNGKPFVDCLNERGIVPGIKVDKGLVPYVNTDGEQWCQGLDGLAQRCAEYYKQGARFCKWRSVVNVKKGPSDQALFDCAYGLARYGAIAQSAGLVPIIEPEVLLDGDHDIDATFAAHQKIWAATFKCMADQGVMFEGILLKPSMVTPGAACPKREDPATVAEYTLKSLKRRVPPAVPGIMFLSGGQSELESTLNLNAMNKTPNPWHVSFSYARALQNTVLKTWKGDSANKEAAQAVLLRRAQANSEAQLGKFEPTAEDKKANENMFVEGYVY